MTLNADQSVTFAGAVTFATGAFTNLSYTGTLIGGTGVITIGTNQFYKDANGNVGIGTASPNNYGSSYKTLALNSGSGGATFFDMLVNGTRTGTSFASAFEVGYGAVTPSIPLTFRTNDTERMRIDSSGNVGIGTTSPARKLQVKGIVGLEAISGSTNTWENYTYTDNSLRWNYNGSGADEMTIDSSGNVGIGTSSPYNKLEAFSSSDGGGVFVRNTTNSNFRGYYIGATGADNTSYGSLALNANTGELRSYVGPNSYGGFQTFYTAGSERMRIDSSGNLLIGTTATNPRDFTSGNGCALRATGGAYEFATVDNNAMFINSTTSASGSVTFIVFNQRGALRGSISTNGSTTSYNTSSDYRLKENVAPMQNALATVQALKPVTYTWKSTGEKSQGFIAHELQAVVPDCVTGEKDAVNEDGSIKPQGIDTSFLVATLTAAIQEQQALIAQLQLDVAALKGTK
jgi:hypothetical protein